MGWEKKSLTWNTCDWTKTWCEGYLIHLVCWTCFENLLSTRESDLNSSSLFGLEQHLWWNTRHQISQNSSFWLLLNQKIDSQIRFKWVRWQLLLLCYYWHRAITKSNDPKQSPSSCLTSQWIRRRSCKRNESIKYSYSKYGTTDRESIKP